MRRVRAALQTECCICCRGRLTVSPLLVVRKVAWVAGEGGGENKGSVSRRTACVRLSPSRAPVVWCQHICFMTQLTLEARAPAHHEPTRVADGGDAAGHIPLCICAAAGAPLRRRPAPAPPACGPSRLSRGSEQATQRVRALSRVPARVRSSAVIRCTRVTVLTIKDYNICAHVIIIYGWVPQPPARAV